MEEKLNLVQEWDKTFPKSEKVNHRKVTFKNHFGITIVADMYTPKNYEGKLSAVAVSGPFGAVKEQASGLYAQEMASNQRTEDFKNGTYMRQGGVADTIPDEAPQFLKDYHAYYKTKRGYHKRSGNSTDGWVFQAGISLMNTRIMHYSNEIRSAVMIVHGENAHSCYMGKDAYNDMIKDNKYIENKELVIVPNATHCDLYDQKDKIPFDKIEEFLRDNLK